MFHLPLKNFTAKFTKTLFEHRNFLSIATSQNSAFDFLIRAETYLGPSQTSIMEFLAKSH